MLYPENNYRIKMETRDGCLIMDRMTDKSWFWSDRRHDWMKDMIDIHLKRDAIERGVKVISHELKPDGVYAIVDWL